MKFGVFQNQYYTPEDDFEATDLFEQAEVMESTGFDSVAVGERHIHEPGFVEPITALAGIAARTDRLALTTTAMVPTLYHPIHLAEQVAMIDRFSDGRMIFGAALGYRDRELEPFGVPPEHRSEAFLRTFELLKQLWRGERISHDGPQWSFEDVFISPTPVGDDLPTWIGGHADIAIKRAAYRANGWIASASSTVEDLEHQIGVYEDALEEFGKDRSDHEVVLMRDCYVADSKEAAREAIEPHLITLYEWYARWGQTFIEEHEIDIDFEELAPKVVYGSPEDCIAELETYADLGVDHVVLRCQFPGQSQASTLRCLERLGEDVIPSFTDQ